MFLATLSILLAGVVGSSARQTAVARVSFQITTVAEISGTRKILSQTTIEGAPGTDFRIDLNTGNYRMQTKFLTDLVAPGKLKLRASLNTRRFYGSSPANLPLYEEDAQNQTFEISFDEMLVLLPFGRVADGEILKVEITPTLAAASVTKAAAPIRINFDKQIPSGEITVAAEKIPHRFVVEAVLFANDQRVAAGSEECLLDEMKEIILAPEPNAKSESGGQRFAADIKIDKYIRNRPKDLIGINFGVSEKTNSGNLQTSLVSGAGAINIIGEEFRYRLENSGKTKNQNYEIRFKIRPAPGEQSD